MTLSQRLRTPRDRFAYAALLAAKQPNRVVFGNDAGLRNNIAGRRRLTECRSAAPVAGRSSEADAVRRRGWARFDGHIPIEVVDEATSSFDRLIADPAYCADLGLVVPEAHRYLIDPLHHVPAIAGMLTGSVTDAIEGFYGTHFRVRSVRAYRNTAPGDLRTDVNVHNNVWHVDPELTCDLRYFVYLTGDVEGEAGSLATIDRSESAAILRTGYLDAGHQLRPSQARLRDAAVTLHAGDRGRAVLIDAQHCLHRAGRVAPGHHRDAVQFWLTPSPEPLSDDWAGRLGPDPAFGHRGKPGAG
jgi:hypothetical protein